jgi:topoisomerase-4 subunit A
MSESENITNNENLDVLKLGEYSKESYLMYSVSVLKDRAIPYIHDGQKPVQRRILYVMNELGLRSDTPPKKSARVVGDIIGKYHPHGDSSVYQALVRMSQDFQLRYPLVDGQGNFGTIDGDSPAAMRYTEARLTPIAELLLSELKYKCVGQVPNYDNTEFEPENLPARLNMMLMNGATGIAVGMSTDIPSHNINEVSAATINLIKNPKITIAELVEDIKGPDFPKGGQIITPKDVIIKNYEKGQGAFTVRCRWKIEKMARGQYQIIIDELPPSMSPSKVLEKIANIESPKLSKDTSGKVKKMSQKQMNDKQFLSTLISGARDDSDKNLRIIIEPKSSKRDPEEIMSSLYKLLGLEENYNMRMVTVGINSRPSQKNLKETLQEWIDYRLITIIKRLQYLLDKAKSRIHILEGREIAQSNIEEVIKIIRSEDSPKEALIEKFKLTEIQAEDILEMKLRSLAKLEMEKILRELDKLKKEEKYYEDLLASDRKLKNLMIKEIKSDTASFSDDRRSLIEETKVAQNVDTHVMLAEKVTIVQSKAGWLTQRKGFDVDLTTIQFKDGDKILKSLEGSTNQALVVLSESGRLFNIKVGEIANGKNFSHINSILALNGDKVIDMLFVDEEIETKYVATNNSGYGFVVNSKDFIVKNKAGKNFMTVKSDDIIYPFREVQDNEYIICKSSDFRCLAYNIEEIKELRAGRGVQLIKLPKEENMLDFYLSKSKDVELEIGKRTKKVNIEEEGLLHKRAGRGKNIKKDFVIS